jgi:dTMP kinase
VVKTNVLKQLSRGLFVVVEGPDGAGKTTFATELVSAINANGGHAVFTFQPSTGSIGEILRSIMAGRSDPHSREEIAALFASDRIQHAMEQVFPHLLLGHTVICDRHVHSSMAYQGAVDGVPTDTIRTLNRFAPQPDVTFIMLPEKRICIERIGSRGKALDGYERTEAFEKAYAYYSGIQCGPHEFMLDAAMSMNVLLQRARLIIENQQGRMLQSLTSK